MRFPLLSSSIIALAMALPTQAVEFQPNDEVAQVQAPTPEQTAALNTTSELQAMSVQSLPQQDATDLAYDFLAEGGVHEGWNVDKKMFVAVSEAIFDAEDPSYDDSFIVKRSLKSMEASLEAKKQIIEYIHMKMSVEDRVSTPGTDLNSKFKDRLDSLEARANAQRERLARLLDETDAREAEMLRGVTFGDRANALMESIIKKLNDEFDSGAIAQEKRASYETAKARYQEAMVEHKATVGELQTHAGSVVEELSSTVETLAKMPLYGAITIAQFESWDENREQYKVAMVTTWSAQQEEMIRAMASGAEYSVPPGQQSMMDYIAGQDWSTATGGRKFRDNQGNFYILGVGSSPVGNSSSSEQRARRSAESRARASVATTLYSDVEAQTRAEQAMMTMSGGDGRDVSIAAESIALEMEQSFENRSVPGISRRFGRRLTHPLSGQDIYVSVYSIDSASIINAQQMMESQYETRIVDERAQQQFRGTKDGYEQAVEHAQENKTAYNEARSTGAAAVSQPIQQLPQKQPAQKSQPSNPAATSGTNQAGSYSGGGNTSAADAFGW